MNSIPPAQKSTEEQYSRIARQLLKRFAESKGQPWNHGPIEVATWLKDEAEANKWARRTLGLYRRSLAWFMRQNGPIEAVNAINDVRPLLSNRGHNTSGKKLKKIPSDKMNRLLEHLNKSRNQLDHSIEHWLLAGLASGLRPCEWDEAHLWGLKLHVRNAKGNAVRANGDKRILEFVLPEHENEINSIRNLLEDIQRWKESGNNFESFYASCRKRLYYVNNLLWPRSAQNISLYSTRHQFAADMKASGLTKNEIAALMGHASDESATIHYARRRSGHVKTPPKITAEQINSVRQIKRQKIR